MNDTNDTKDNKKESDPFSFIPKDERTVDEIVSTLESGEHTTMVQVGLDVAALIKAKVSGKDFSEKFMTGKIRGILATVFLNYLNTVPAFVFDPMLSKMLGEYHLYPTNLERLLEKRGQYSEDKSDYDIIVENYGLVPAWIAEALI